MKKLLFLFAFIPCLSFAQFNPNFYFNTVKDYGAEAAVPAYYLLADSVLIRDCDSKTCTAIDMVTIGTRVIILEKSTKSEVWNGVSSHWYKVKTKKTTGWVLGIFIAQRAFGSNGDPTVKFLMGWGKASENERSYQIRAIRYGKQIDQLEVRALTYGVYPDQIRNLGNKGMPVDDVISIDFPCLGGCGCQTGETVVFWDGQKLHHVDDLKGTGDAWASFGTRFIYPSDMDGIGGTIIKVFQGYVDTVLDENGQERHKNGIKKSYYKWNGSKLVLADIKTEEIFYYPKFD